jgi:hypothetical protein
VDHQPALGIRSDVVEPPVSRGLYECPHLLERERVLDGLFVSDLRRASSPSSANHAPPNDAFPRSDGPAPPIGIHKKRKLSLVGGLGAATSDRGDLPRGSELPQPTGKSPC